MERILVVESPRFSERSSIPLPIPIVPGGIVSIIEPTEFTLTNKSGMQLDAAWTLALCSIACGGVLVSPESGAGL